MAIDPRENPKCVHCETTDLDDQMRLVFGVLVCSNCKKENPDKYSLLTKTECKEDYLLTERASHSSPFEVVILTLSSLQPNSRTPTSCPISSVPTPIVQPTAT